MLKLYYHPLSSFCWKALIALYETGAPFEPVIVDPGDASSAAAFKAIWPLGKFPVLRDEARDRTLPESSIIIEYLAQNYPGGSEFVPNDPDQSLEVRLRDRFFDLYVHDPMQRIVADRLRPTGNKDPHGVEAARALLATSYAMLEREMGEAWAAGDIFTMADCAAAPALFYGNEVAPFGDAHGKVAAYLERLKRRPSFARVLEEAQPYFNMFPRS